MAMFTEIEPKHKILSNMLMKSVVSCSHYLDQITFTGLNLKNNDKSEKLNL